MDEQEIHQFVPRKIEIEKTEPDWKRANNEATTPYKLEIGNDIADSHLYFNDQELTAIVGLGVVMGQVDADIKPNNGMPYILVKIPAFRVKIVNTENRPVVLERKG